MTSKLESNFEFHVTDAEIMPLYAVPVCKYLWPDSEALNAELKRVILAKMDDSPGVVKTNRGGWQSKADLHTWPDECVKIFLGRILALVREIVRRTVLDPSEQHLDNWEIRAWANVNRKGAFNAAHNHDGFGTIWSAFYYVDPGGSDSGVISGRTKFQDRSGVPKEMLRNPNPFEREVTITPTAGLMVMFPATLYHYVEPYQGDRERITIAFNLKNPSFVIPYYEGMQEVGWWWANFRGLMLIPQKVPEKLRALWLLPRKFAERRLPQTARWEDWKEYLHAAIDHATAEASARSAQKRAQPK